MNIGLKGKVDRGSQSGPRLANPGTTIHLFSPPLARIALCFGRRVQPDVVGWACGDQEAHFISPLAIAESLAHNQPLLLLDLGRGIFSKRFALSTSWQDRV
ncbi:predicted protein [Histoplasma capsulatum var. duboisii H88]|uniref:Predicted protein n=2 Tax=Ajellomyces capsulatus TaxID=5037 RepID=F0UQR3_AJEC8|nr:predicted protein [Histoplasma capsulatum H143]EGC48240.1 predicted protein [Histoplasma capsulatum var. duboisii H88]